MRGFGAIQQGDFLGDEVTKSFLQLLSTEKNKVRSHVHVDPTHSMSIALLHDQVSILTRYQH